MKKFLTVCLCFVTLLSVFSGCNSEKSYVGKYYSKEARAMNMESVLSVNNENNEKVFEMKHIYDKDNSALIKGTYEEKSDRRLILIPEIKIMVTDGVPTETEIDDKTPIRADIKGDIISLDEDIIYIKEGSKTAETDTTVKNTQKKKSK